MYSMAFVYSLTADLVFSRISPTLEDILTVLNFLRAKMFASKAIFRVILNYIGFSPYRPTPESIPILLYLFDESFGSLFLLPCESVFAWALAPTYQVGVETSLGSAACPHLAMDFSSGCGTVPVFCMGVHGQSSSH